MPGRIQIPMRIYIIIPDQSKPWMRKKPAQATVCRRIVNKILLV